MKAMNEERAGGEGEGETLLPLAFGSGNYNRSRSHNDMAMMYHQSERSILTPPQEGEEVSMVTNDDDDNEDDYDHDYETKPKEGGGIRIIALSFTVVGILLVALISFHSWILNEMNDGRTTPTTLTAIDTSLITTHNRIDTATTITTYEVVSIEEEDYNEKKKKKNKKDEKKKEEKEKKKNIEDIEDIEEEIEEEADDDDDVDVDDDDDDDVFAYVNLMRHGEKDENSGEGLSQLGEDRAEHYARCIAGNTGEDGNSKEEEAELRQTIPSLSFPVPIGSLYSQLNATISPAYKGNVGLSHRSKDTLLPLSYATGLHIDTPCKMTEMECFTDTVTKLIKANTVTLVTWEHKLFPILLKNLLLKGGAYSASLLLDGGLDKVADNVDGFSKLMKQNDNRWPQACDAESFKNPRIVKPGKQKVWKGEDFPFHGACFDIVWQIKYVFNKGKKSKITSWKPVSVKQIQNGFGGNANAPCVEGLKPLK